MVDGESARGTTPVPVKAAETDPFGSLLRRTVSFPFTAAPSAVGWKINPMAQLLPPGRLPLRTPPWIGHAPAMTLVVSRANGPLDTFPLSPRGDEPLLVSVSTLVALAELTATLPNATWDGESAVAATPVPLSGTVSCFGPAAASSITVRLLARTDPNAVGVNVTEIVQYPPAKTAVPTAHGLVPVLTIAYGGGAVMDVNESGMIWLFVRVRVLVVLVVF
jgi:hypothetical protein